MSVVVAFRPEETSEGETIGPAVVWDREQEARPPSFAAPTMLGWMTLERAEAYARSMRYELLVVGAAPAAH